MISIKNEALAWATAEVAATGATGIPPDVWSDMFADALADYERALLPVLTVPAKYLPPHDRGPVTSSTAMPVYLRLPDEFIVEDYWTEDAPALAEDIQCSCGAGHGSLEGHLDWCDWLNTQIKEEQ